MYEELLSPNTQYSAIQGYIENITCLRVDMNFIFEWSTRYLTSELKSACFQRHDLLCNHNDSDLFTCEDNMLSSRVKI